MIDGPPGEKPTVFFDTARMDGENSRCLAFSNPVKVLQAYSVKDVLPVIREAEEWTEEGGYAAGFIAYEAGYAFLPNTTCVTAPGLPLVWFGLFDTADTFDVSAVRPPGPYQIRSTRFGLDEQEYARAIDRIRSLIHEGDVYQINFTDKITFDFSGDPFGLYLDLRQRQRVAYGAFVQTGDFALLSLSPELFFRRDGDQILTRPMKGTIRRGRTTDEDLNIAETLRLDPKNRAENVMIVDLLRNDLSVVCEPGSVQVPDLFTTERFETLIQMTSTVVGRLKKDTSYPDIFSALFPCGSVTGAPKLRSIQRIQELERGPRGVYCGAVGFMAPERYSVFNVAIRTVLLSGSHGEMGSGSGIVWDSDASSEYRECALKAKFLTEKSVPFSLIASIKWHGGFEFLDAHIDRLRASAHYFSIPFPEEKIMLCLENLVADTVPEQVYKIRLLLGPEGIERAEKLPYKIPNEPLKLSISDERIDSESPFFYHKTTRRDVYTAALAQARASGTDEPVLLNERGEVAEGARSNLFVESGGIIRTPPVASGLLAGVFRANLLESRPEIREEVLFPSDLTSADRIFCTNVMWGWKESVLVTR